MCKNKHKEFNIKQMNKTDNNKNLITHGLLSEDFKQNLLNLVQNHQLDIQTKAIILDSVLLATNIAAKQQTQKEIDKYNKSHENEERKNDKKESS